MEYGLYVQSRIMEYGLLQRDYVIWRIGAA